MKSTDLERRDREIKKAMKKQSVLKRKTQRDSRTAGDYINLFEEAFFYDEEKIYNIERSEDILVLLEEMKDDLTEKHWVSILRKSVKKTKVKQKTEAIEQLANLAEIELADQSG